MFRRRNEFGTVTVQAGVRTRQMSKVDNTASSRASASSMATGTCATMKVNRLCSLDRDPGAHRSVRRLPQRRALQRVVRRAHAGGGGGAADGRARRSSAVRVSLNLLTASVGASGGGVRGTADKSRSRSRCGSSVGGRQDGPAVTLLPIGTGMEVNRTYATATRTSPAAPRSSPGNTDTALFWMPRLSHPWPPLPPVRGATLVPGTAPRHSWVRTQGSPALTPSAG